MIVLTHNRHDKNMNSLKICSGDAPLHTVVTVKSQFLLLKSSVCQFKRTV